MATLYAGNPTLLDVSKRLDLNGKVDPGIVEILDQTNEAMPAFTWVEANGYTGHRSTIRTGLPLPTWRKLYGGVLPTKSTTAQVTDSIGMLEAYAEVDKALADLNGNTAAFRLSEEKPHIEGMGQEFMSTFIYGNESLAPEEFTGLAPRYASTSGESGSNVLTSGTTDSSMWLIVMSPQTVHCIYPKGSKAGLQVTDKGQVTIENAANLEGTYAAGGRYEAYRTHFRWDCGAVVRDWRYAVRICYDKDAFTYTTATVPTAGTDLTNMMSRACELLPGMPAGSRAFFMANRHAKSYLRQQIAAKVGASTLTMDQVGGKHVLTFDGLPVYRCDALVGTETAVS